MTDYKQGTKLHTLIRMASTKGIDTSISPTK